MDAGAFQFQAGAHHTVQLQYPNGGLNINWWAATNVAG
jgi:hypothetical protein